MRILVSGGAGYIGSFTVHRLLAEGHSVVVFDNLSLGHAAAVPAGLLRSGDLADTAGLDALFAAEGIEAVIHFAASTAVGESVVEPAIYYRNNITNSLHLIEAARRHGVRRFVFSSTAATYGVPQQVPIPEDHLQSPVNPYGRTKLVVEQMLADFAAAYGLGFAALRYFNAAGASIDGTRGEDHTPETHLIPLALQTALGRRSHLDLFGTDYPTPDGTCIRDFVHVEDLADAHLRALAAIEPGRGRAWNVGTGTGYSVREVIRTCEEVCGRAIPVREGPRRAGDPPALVADPARIRRELGWEPRFPALRSIIETAWRWHSSHPHGYAG
ncbi:MAG: UDP-glucose 4-epimerase GalE [Fimbriiglobus sp.]|jgi:UDP-glucose-4-epimerase GalE|nr:UDP-glucose 4-epimerase GalE [Fimbriiglobus sp.]